jgi:leucyl aminopeptidase
MRFSNFLAAVSASSALALTIPARDTATEVGSRAAPTKQLFTIETAPGETKQVTEAEKWALKKVHPLLRHQHMHST